MQKYLHLDPPYRIVLCFSLIVAVIAIFALALELHAPGIDAAIADKDFSNYWIAGRLIQNGNALDLFGPQPAYFSHLTAVFGDDFPWHNWSYPPHYLLLIWPLGLLGYKSAFLLFLGITAWLFLLAYRAFVGRLDLLALVAVAPFMIFNLWCAQNGYLCGALMLGALASREGRPVVAGILLGLLTIKPQLGLLFPFLLIAERRWVVIGVAIASASTLVALSALIFGLDSWRGYIEHVLPYQSLVMTDLTGLFLHMLSSTYGALRNWGIEANPALVAHGLVAVAVALISIVAFFRLADGQDRACVFLAATFLVTPYALSYDLGGFAAAVAVLAAKPVAPGHQQVRTAILAFAMLLPIIMIPLGMVGLTVAPIVIFSVWLFALRDSGYASYGVSTARAL